MDMPNSFYANSTMNAMNSAAPNPSFNNTHVGSNTSGGDNAAAMVALLASLTSSNSNVNNNVISEDCSSNNNAMQHLQSQFAYQQLLSQLGIPHNSDRALSYGKIIEQ
jgi:hypothetical protein